MKTMSGVPDTKSLMIELKHDHELERLSAATAFGAVAAGAALPALAGVTIDPTFAPVTLPGAQHPLVTAALDEDEQPSDNVDLGAGNTYIVRAKVAEGEDPKVIAARLRKENQVVQVWADVPIQSMTVCPGAPAMGNTATVAALLGVPRLAALHMNGRGVRVAVVDTGINLAYLNAHGMHPHFDAAASWVPHAGLTPGQLPVNHGTMCAYDVCIAAPQCTLLDVALLQSTAAGPNVMSGLLSDGVRAYRHLMNLMTGPALPGQNRSLVVTNSWGMFHPSWDFPPGTPGNYSDDPHHPFNRIVTALERLGADILFAAGNCGPTCPDGRCQGITNRPIYGANSHPRVLSIGGVDVTKNIAGYSSQGPGHLARRKPDVCGFTHFAGSGVYAADGGTSAATPVVAGVLAAYRTVRPYRPGLPGSLPARLRTLVRHTAEDRGAAGYDYAYGYGVISGRGLADAVSAADAQPMAERRPERCPNCGYDLGHEVPAEPAAAAAIAVQEAGKTRVVHPYEVGTASASDGADGGAAVPAAGRAAGQPGQG